MGTTATDMLKRDRNALEEELKQMGARFKGKSCTCPFHEDIHASAGVFEKDGDWWFKCHVPTCGWGGDIFDVRAYRSKKTSGEVMNEVNGVQSAKPQPTKRVFPTVAAILESVQFLGEVQAHYVYSDPASGAAQIVQVRYWNAESDKKSFLVHHTVQGGFVLGAPPKPWPIYNRARVASSPVVVVVEGEKCVHALHAIGIVATTSLSGAINADKADWSPLAGKKIYIWPDKDAPGKMYGEAVLKMLGEISPRPELFMIDVEQLALPTGHDAADFITADMTSEDVWATIREVAVPVGEGHELAERIEDILSGKWSAIKWPWKFMGKVIKSLYPGTWTMLGGDPSATKSILLLQAAYEWHVKGTKVAIYELEDDKAYHMYRLLAIVSGKWDMLDDDWCRDNPDEVNQLKSQHEEQTKAFSPCMYDAPNGDLTYTSLLKWVKTRCEEGCRVLCIDPITAVDVERPFVEDKKFIRDSSIILKQHGACIVCCTHPRTAGKKFGQVTQDDLAGARSFSRSVQNIIWLSRHEPSKMFKVKDPDGLERDWWCNRSLRVLKARMSQGLGARFGFNLTKDVRFVEEGMIVKELKRSTDDAPSELDSLF